MMPTNEYVEVRNGGYYVAETRIGIDVVVHDFRNARSAPGMIERFERVKQLRALKQA